jgi:hypothetical protein
MEAARLPADDILVKDPANVKEVEEEVEAANVYSDTVVFAAGHQYAYVRRTRCSVVPKPPVEDGRCPLVRRGPRRNLLLLINPSCSLFFLHQPRSPNWLPFPPFRHCHSPPPQNELPISPIHLEISTLAVQDCFRRALCQTQLSSPSSTPFRAPLGDPRILLNHQSLGIAIADPRRCNRPEGICHPDLIAIVEMMVQEVHSMVPMGVRVVHW